MNIRKFIGNRKPSHVEIGTWIFVAVVLAAFNVVLGPCYPLAAGSVAALIVIGVNMGETE